MSNFENFLIKKIEIQFQTVEQNHPTDRQLTQQAHQNPILIITPITIST